MSISAQKNSLFYAMAAKDTVPASTTKTGTIATLGINVTGAGTAFRSELKLGDWIVDLAQDEVRKVMNIRSDTFLTIDSAFTIDLAALTALVVVRSRAKMISITNAGGADGDVDGVALVSGETVSFPKSNKNPDGKDFIDPLIVDPTGTTIKVLIQK